MNEMKILICGTRKKGYEKIVRNTLGLISYSQRSLEIIEGCCPDSADEYAEKYAHFPSTTGNYLKRNIEMVELADEVIAFWDNFSYGKKNLPYNSHCN